MDAIGDNLFIIIFLVISFLSWISSKIRERGQGSGPPTYEQPEAEPTFERQARTETAPPAQDPMKQILEALGIPQEEQPAPPPLPQDQPPEPPPVPRPPRQEARPKKASVDDLSKTEREALARVQAGKGIASKARKRSGISARSMLSPHNLQAAFALKEILDKPKSLRLDSHS